MELECEVSKQNSSSSGSITKNLAEENNTYNEASFAKFWRDITNDNHLTLYGFQRYRTIHLLNLRYLEAEIKEIDHDIFQAGLALNHLPVLDTLGLKHAKKDVGAPTVEEIVNPALVTRLRELLKQYDEALMAFNRLMTMETFSLADNPPQSNSRNDLNPYETYKTRLVRADLPPRTNSRDPIQHYIRKGLRASWYYLRSQKGVSQDEESGNKSPASVARARFNRSYQNTARVAETLTRFVIAILAGAFLVGPLIILSSQKSTLSHLTTVSICVVIFSFVVSLLSKATNYETMAASAAYAAVLSVFISGST